MNKPTGFKIAALAAGLLGAVALAAPATAQMHMHTSTGWHSTFHSRPTVTTRTWHGGGRGGYWHGRYWHPGWRGGVAIGFYGGYPYYGDPYYGYGYGYYPYGGYYGGAYNYCDYPYDYDGDCDDDY